MMTDSIRDLYPFALAEGEGVGTAYEYRAKARFIRPIERRLGPGARILVAGLPEKYGTSLDFAIMAHRRRAALHIVDERPEALERARRAIDAVTASGQLVGLVATFRQVETLDAPASERYDAVLSCEVLQRVASEKKRAFADGLRHAAPMGAVFVPNAENGSHLKISHLAGLRRADLAALFDKATFAYVDMPPFPPGIARTSEQRAKASTGIVEAAAMRVLDAVCAAERFGPSVLTRHVSHIVCARWGA